MPAAGGQAGSHSTPLGSGAGETCPEALAGFHATDTTALEPPTHSRHIDRHRGQGVWDLDADQRPAAFH